MGLFSKRKPEKEERKPVYNKGDQVYFPIDGTVKCHRFVLGEIWERTKFVKGWFYLIRKFPYDPNGNEPLIEVEEAYLYPKTNTQTA